MFAQQNGAARLQRGFTLIELMVVISIILLATAVAVPAVTKFSRGQLLANTGRLLQSAINEARRASITSRRRHYLICFREADDAGRNRFAFKVFQEARLESDGFTKTEFALPNSVELQCDLVNVAGLYGIVAEPQTAGALPPGVVIGNPGSGCHLAIFDNSPKPQTAPYTAFFTYPALLIREDHPNKDRFTQLRFNKDGSATFVGGPAFVGPRGIDPYEPVNGQSLYDLNVTFAEAQLKEADIIADFAIRQLGEPKKRCFVDLDPNTGRARYRVCQLDGYSGAAGGLGAQSQTGN